MPQRPSRRKNPHFSLFPQRQTRARQQPQRQNRTPKPSRRQQPIPQRQQRLPALNPINAALKFLAGPKRQQQMGPNRNARREQKQLRRQPLDMNKVMQIADRLKGRQKQDFIGRFITPPQPDEQLHSRTKGNPQQMSKKAFEELSKMWKNERYFKSPSTEALRRLKEEIVTQLFDPQSQITSFDALRQMLKENRICANEGQFQQIMKSIFDREETRLLETTFQSNISELNPQIWFLPRQKAA